jgi:hypothetical protein
VKLIDALKRAGIPSGYLQSYFIGATLVGSILFIPDKVTAESVAKNFGQQLSTVIPKLRIRVGEAPKPDPGPSYLNAAGKRAWRLAQATQPKLPG